MGDGTSPILSVNQLNKQFGPGCDRCRGAERRKLEKNYCRACGTVYSCQNVSFDLYRGEILGIVGESGSGKSTLMRCLYFDQEVTSGEAYLQPYQD
ncbi:MAG: phnK, partial [Paenibacillus sp.]|nr:phnK [Paenibacillus sp.]